ncbi:MAG: ABC transporter permease [Sedimentisphaerales bacterium]|nr:ABC transporter permease [Sedimentisphaerales bacterium]
MDRVGIYLVGAVLVVIGDFVSDEFLTVTNLLSVLNAVALLGIVATGMAFVTYSGNMADLSMPSIMAFSGIICVSALPLGFTVALTAGILAGLLIGAMNGFIVGRFNANPILWTLAVTFFMEGFMRFAWSNNQVYPDIEPGTAGFKLIGLFRMSIGSVPLVVVVMVLLFIAGHFVIVHTRFGIESKLVGSSKPAARTTGIDVSRVILLDFLVAAFCASIAGIFLTSMNKLGVFYLGKGYDFKAVTAVVIGGMTLRGGRGTMPGVLGGVLVIGLLTNIMTFMGIGAFEQNIVTGGVFIAVVGLHQRQLCRRGKDYA